MCWMLTYDNELRTDLTPRFTVDDWPWPIPYLDAYNTFADWAEVACIYQFLYLICKYGNISGKVAPPETQFFLNDLWVLADENAEQRRNHRPPFPQ